MTGRCQTPAPAKLGIHQTQRWVSISAIGVVLLCLSGLAAADSTKVTWSGNGHQYQRIDGSFTWTEAKQKCEALGGYLASLTSLYENAFVKANVLALTTPDPTRLGWIGATDIEKEGYWKWTSGETWSIYDTWSNTDWTSGEPNNAGGVEHYLNFWLSNGKVSWNDRPVDFTQAAICEFEQTVPPVTQCSESYNAGVAAAKAACKADPASCGITTGSTTTYVNAAMYDPTTNLINIPLLGVPNIFGSVTYYGVNLEVLPTSPISFKLYGTPTPK